MDILAEARTKDLHRARYSLALAQRIVEAVTNQTPEDSGPRGSEHPPAPVNPTSVPTTGSPDPLAPFSDNVDASKEDLRQQVIDAWHRYCNDHPDMNHATSEERREHLDSFCKDSQNASLQMCSKEQLRSAGRLIRYSRSRWRSQDDRLQSGEGRGMTTNLDFSLSERIGQLEAAIVDLARYVAGQRDACPKCGRRMEDTGACGGCLWPLTILEKQ